MLDDGTKRCPRCRKHLPFDQFYKAGNKHRMCKKCKRAYTREHYESTRIHSQTYRNKHGDRLVEKAILWLKNHPERRKAHWILNNAVKRGKIAKPTKCPECGFNSMLIGYIADTNRPLLVRWVCKRCHYRIIHPDWQNDPNDA